MGTTKLSVCISIYIFVYVCWYVVHGCVCECLCVCLCVQTMTLEGSRGTRQEQLVLHWGWLGTPGRATSQHHQPFLYE